jgi:hypothetical protein
VMFDREEQIQIKPGMLVRLINYYCGFDEYKGDEVILGMYLRTGREAQFEFYEIAVVKDREGHGGYVQRYLTSDFFIGPF